MDINSVKQDILIVKDIIPNCVGLSSYQINALAGLIDLASIVISAPVSTYPCGCYDGPTQCSCYEDAIQSDRLLWAKVMLRLPEIIQEWNKGYMKLEHDEHESLSDAIKNKLGVNG